MEKEILTILNTKGVSGLTDNALKDKTYYNKLIKLNKKNLDMEEFCCKILDREDDYIMYISICNDE